MNLDNLSPEQREAFKVSATRMVSLLMGGPEAWAQIPTAPATRNVDKMVEIAKRDPGYLDRNFIDNVRLSAQAGLEMKLIEMLDWAVEHGREDLTETTAARITLSLLEETTEEAEP